MTSRCNLPITVDDWDVDVFKIRYNITEEEGANDNLIAWLCSLTKFIIQRQIPQNNACVAMTGQLMDALGFDADRRTWQFCCGSPNSETQRNAGKITSCLSVNMKNVTKLDNGLIILNPVDIVCPSVMIKCGHMENAFRAGNNKRDQAIIDLMILVLDFDITRIPDGPTKPIRLEEKKTIQMYHCKTVENTEAVLRYMKLLPLVLDGVLHDVSLLAILVTRPVGLDQLLGTQLSLSREVITLCGGVDTCTSIILPVHEYSKFKWANCWTFVGQAFFWRRLTWNQLPFEQDYYLLFHTFFDNMIKFKLLVWLALIREEILHRITEPGERFVLLSRDNVDQINDLQNRLPHLSFLPSAYDASDENPLLQQLHSIYPCEDIFNKSDVSGGIVLNPLTYMPTGTRVCLIAVEKFYAILRQYTVTGDNFARRRSHDFRPHRPDTTPFYPMVLALTETEYLTGEHPFQHLVTVASNKNKLDNPTKPPPLLEQFQQKPDQNFICSICLGVLYNPVMVANCSHIFCDECLNKAIVDRNSCPLCKGCCYPSDIRPAPVLVKSILDAIPLHCCQHCKKTVLLGDYQRIQCKQITQLQ